MTGGTPRIYNTEYALYKGELSQEEILLLATYAKALKNKSSKAKELRDKVLRIVDKIRLSTSIMIARPHLESEAMICYEDTQR